MKYFIVVAMGVATWVAIKLLGAASSPDGKTWQLMFATGLIFLCWAVTFLFWKCWTDLAEREAAVVLNPKFGVEHGGYRVCWSKWVVSLPYFRRVVKVHKGEFVFSRDLDSSKLPAGMKSFSALVSGYIRPIDAPQLVALYGFRRFLSHTRRRTSYGYGYLRDVTVDVIKEKLDDFLLDFLHGCMLLRSEKGAESNDALEERFAKESLREIGFTMKLNIIDVTYSP